MKISLTMVGCDCDILEAWVRYHTTVLDRMVLVLHGEDIDGSHHIAQQLQREGLPIDLIRKPHPAFAQSEILTNILQSHILPLQPEWILPLDCDEFLVTTDTATVRTHLASLQPNVLWQIPWRTYVPMAEDSAEPHPLLRIMHRRLFEDPAFYKVIIPYSLTADSSLAIQQGAHAVCQGDQVLPAQTHPHLALAHVPVRSAAQLATKALIGTIRHQAYANRTLSQSFHRRPIFERVQTGQPLLPEEVTAFAMGYASKAEQVALVSDPVAIPPSACVLRYTVSSPDPVQAAAHARRELEAWNVR